MTSGTPMIRSIGATEGMAGAVYPIGFYAVSDAIRETGMRKERSRPQSPPNSRNVCNVKGGRVFVWGAKTRQVA